MRRTFLAGVAASSIGRAAAAAPPAMVRLGVLPFGSLQWIAAIIENHRLDVRHGFTLQTVALANTDALKVALLGGSVDIAMSDWPFVAEQRRRGGALCFAAGASNCLGGVMVPPGSPVQRLGDLKGRRLGVAGGPADKSWLLVRAAGLREAIDLPAESTLSYGAPPLLDAVAQRGGLDAVLTFWNFAARLDTAGFTEAVSVAACARRLGLAGAPCLVGYVFDENWAHANRPAIDGFLAAAQAASEILATSPAEWDRIRPLINAPSNALLQNLRSRFIAGLGTPSVNNLQDQAARLQSLLAAASVMSGPSSLPPGVFWRAGDAG